MLIQYTPIAELSEEEKNAVKATMHAGKQNSFVIINGKTISINELKAQTKPPIRQKLFE